MTDEEDFSQSIEIPSLLILIVNYSMNWTEAQSRRIAVHLMLQCH